MSAKSGKAPAVSKQAGRKKVQTIKLAASSSQSVEYQAYTQLQQAAKIKSCLELGCTAEAGNGLLTTQRKGKDEVNFHLAPAVFARNQSRC